MPLDDQKLNDEDKEERLHTPGNQDGTPPFSAPDDVKQPDVRNDAHPKNDDPLDSDEEYQYGADADLQDDEEPDENDHATRIA